MFIFVCAILHLINIWPWLVVVCKFRFWLLIFTSFLISSKKWSIFQIFDINFFSISFERILIFWTRDSGWRCNIIFWIIIIWWSFSYFFSIIISITFVFNILLILPLWLFNRFLYLFYSLNIWNVLINILLDLSCIRFFFSVWIVFITFSFLIGEQWSDRVVSAPFWGIESVVWILIGGSRRCIRSIVIWWLKLFV